jgi:hypothetical protein
MIISEIFINHNIHLTIVFMKGDIKYERLGRFSILNKQLIIFIG